MLVLQSQANQMKSHHKRPMGQTKTRWFFSSYSVEQEWEGKFWKFGGPHKKMIASIHFKAPPPTLTLVNHVHTIKFMGNDVNHYFISHLKLWQG